MNEEHTLLVGSSISIIIRSIQILFPQHWHHVFQTSSLYMWQVSKSGTSIPGNQSFCTSVPSRASSLTFSEILVSAYGPDHAKGETNQSLPEYASLKSFNIFQSHPCRSLLSWVTFSFIAMQVQRLPVSWARPESNHGKQECSTQYQTASKVITTWIFLNSLS